MNRRKVEIFIGPIACTCAGGPTPARQEKITRAFALEGWLRDMSEAYEPRAWRLGDDRDYEQGIASLRACLSAAGEDELAVRLAFALDAATPAIAVDGQLMWLRDCPTVEEFQEALAAAKDLEEEGR